MLLRTDVTNDEEGYAFDGGDPTDNIDPSIYDSEISRRFKPYGDMFELPEDYCVTFATTLEECEEWMKDLEQEESREVGIYVELEELHNDLKAPPAMSRKDGSLLAVSGFARVPRSPMATGHHLPSNAFWTARHGTRLPSCPWTGKLDLKLTPVSGPIFTTFRAHAIAPFRTK